MYKKEDNIQSMSNPVKKRFDETRHYIDKKDKRLEERIEALEDLWKNMPDDLFGLLSKFSEQ